jgi:hypothetical protein
LLYDKQKYSIADPVIRAPVISYKEKRRAEESQYTGNKMTKKVLVIVLLLFKAVCGVRAFNYSAFYEKDGSNRDGKFLFDSLFGLEFEEEFVNTDATNSLKSCDCGE